MHEVVEMTSLIEHISDKGKADVVMEIVTDQSAVDVRCLSSHIVGLKSGTRTRT